MFMSDWSAPRHHILGKRKGFIAHVARFCYSSHTRDLFTIALSALTAAFFVPGVALYVVALWGKPAADTVPVELQVALFTIAAGVMSWAYQAANTRFGVADLFAAEIVTICRVAAVADFMPRYVRLFDGGAKFPPHKSSHDYLIAFDNNAKDLEVLDGDVVRFVAQFYIYMKALQDSLERGADPENAAWRDSALTIIYNAFLAFESARQAITVLIDDSRERKEYVLTTLLNELPAYLLLLKEVRDIDGVRKQRIEARRDSYERLIGGIRADFPNIKEPAQDSAGLIVRLWDASGAKDGPVLLPPRLQAHPHSEAAD